MLRYLLVLLATICYMVQTDTAVNILPAGKPSNNANDQNFNPAQQYIYIYGPQQWKMKNAVNLIDKAASDYLITPGMDAHKFHIRKLSWNKARKICTQEGGHLVVVNSNSEEKLLIRIMDENKVNQAWLGVHDLYEEGDWSMIMDELLEVAGYSRWTTKFSNTPDNYNGKQHCGNLLKESGLDDLECSTANSFFCEITL